MTHFKHLLTKITKRMHHQSRLIVTKMLYTKTPLIAWKVEIKYFLCKQLIIINQLSKITSCLLEIEQLQVAVVKALNKVMTKKVKELTLNKCIQLMKTILNNQNKRILKGLLDD